jgi:hypothetical protein
MVQNDGVRRILDEWLHVKFQVNTFARGDSALPCVRRADAA